MNDQPLVRAVDVLIITAHPEELDALLAVEEGDLGSCWEPKKDSAGFPYYVREFQRDGTRPLKVAAASAHEIGATASGNAATRLVLELKPYCLAMCGVCAGNKGEVFLGDVIVADRVFFYDHGKLVAHRDGDGTRNEEFHHDLTTYALRPQWKQRVHDIIREWGSALGDDRPLSFAVQEQWLLHQLHDFEHADGLSPLSDPERDAHCPDWATVVERLRKSGDLQERGLKLTGRGASIVEEDRILHPEGPPGDPALKVHLGPIGTGSPVVQDPEIFQRLEKVERKTLGLEMEAAAIGLVAEENRDIVRERIVVKGVQDYADGDKNDHFRVFAAKASAEVLLGFLRRHLQAGDALGPQTSTNTPPQDDDYKVDRPQYKLLEAKLDKNPVASIGGAAGVGGGGGVGKSLLAAHYARQHYPGTRSTCQWTPAPTVTGCSAYAKPCASTSLPRTTTVK